MAKQYGKNNAVDFAAANLMSFGKSFSRLNGQPLDKSEIWYNDFAALEAYALTDAAYVGQKVVYIDIEAGTVSHYSIEVDGTLKPLGNTEELRAYIGEIPEGSDAKTIIEYINDKTSGIATDAALTELQESVESLEKTVNDEETGLVKNVSDLKTQVGEGTVSDQIDDKIEALDLANTYEAKGAAATAKTEIESVIGEVAEGKTVTEMISDAQTAATYDDTQVKADIKANTDAIATNKTDIEGKLTAAQEALQGNIDLKANAADVFTKTETETAITTAADAAEEKAVNRLLGYLADEEVNVDFDTLKEVAAWIDSDTTQSAQIITRISNIEADYLKGADKTELQGSIDELVALVGELPEGAASATVVQYIQEVVDGLKIGDYAKAADLTELAGKVTELEGVVANKVDKAEGYRLMAEAEGTKLEGIEAGAQVNKIESVGEEFNLAEDKHLTIAAIEQSKVTGLEDALKSKVNAVEGSRLMTEDEATKLEKLVMDEDGSVSISGTVAAGNVEGLDSWITSRAATLKGLSENNLDDTLLGKLNAIEAGAQVNIIDAVSPEFTIASDGKTLNIASVHMSKVTGLPEALAAKVDAVEGKGLSTNDLTDELLEKLNAADTNLIEIVKVNGTALQIADDKSVDIIIPVATAEVAGTVKSSAGENKVSVAEDGTMEVNTISISKIVQAEDEVLILNGGAAGTF